MTMAAGRIILKRRIHLYRLLYEYAQQCSYSMHWYFAPEKAVNLGNFPHLGVPTVGGD